ncbi:unnamed protein product [Rangifer tarandus platyrhynchus]|uniref:Uncharacterized protein n=2 Tax=Rangifer tarandus platyrhynchus TaxID=3082113 RepID=A0ACB0FM94_RANTA|nr:unnamed protein product [Rangifer tarandus platyrhynchus]CAI9714012.1 unnamed protein product [Rangifer tarandus platyrhynchus]
MLMSSKDEGLCEPIRNECICNIALGKSHYIFYGLVAAVQPQMLVTFNEELWPLPVNVRLGQDGKPKTITGFQAHTTPEMWAY